jgi:hypothetical protein
MPGLTMAPTMVPVSCAWLCGPPQGPSDPFGSPALIVYDTMRLICIALATIAVLLTGVYLLRRPTVPGQQARFLTSAGFAIVAVSVEVEHFGDYANWRLILVFICSAGAAWGNYSALRMESPPTPGWHGPERRRT